MKNILNITKYKLLFLSSDILKTSYVIFKIVGFLNLCTHNIFNKATEKILVGYNTPP